MMASAKLEDMNPFLPLWNIGINRLSALSLDKRMKALSKILFYPLTHRQNLRLFTVAYVSYQDEIKIQHFTCFRYALIFTLGTK